VTFFDEIRAYVGWTEEDSRQLARLAPHLPRVLDELVDDFYAVILAHEETRRILADEAQLLRLKQSMRDWARSMLEGPHDLRWFELRSKIGRRHVEVGLPQRYMPLAMNRLRAILQRLAIDVEGRELARLRPLIAAIDKALDLELTIMLETYAALQQGRVRQAEQLGTLGRLAASVSHELKNPLAVINTSLHLLEKQLALPESKRDAAVVATHVKRIGRSSRQAAKMSSQLLDYARSKRPVPRTVTLGALVDEALSLVDEHAGVAIEARAEPPEATAFVDPADLAQVLANLVRNAVQSIEESRVGGRITMVARRDRVGLGFVVTDDGPGVAPEHLEKIFEPLFTTRTHGTGLGLAIARDLVEAHGGRITVASTPGRGAVFTVLIPQEATGALAGR
jgi:signal transduction histidine kinase